MKQFFSVYETGLFCKCLPKSFYLSITKKYTSGFKPSKDRVLLGDNANGDFKFKLFLIFQKKIMYDNFILSKLSVD